jgi:hypothetical protein
MKKQGVLKMAIAGCLGLCLVGTAAPLAFAHHAANNFDRTKNYLFKGTVKKWLWVNPHAWLYIDVTKADGSTELWGFETAGTNSLARAGWSADAMKTGDKLTVYGSPDRTGIHNGSLNKVVLTSGRELTIVLGPPPSAGGPPAGGGPNVGADVPITEYK